MLNCRSISPETWEHARRVLVFYFSRRLRNHAEDLAQETLATLWGREDYQFEREEDFLLICHAFARNILRSGFRRERKFAASELMEDTVSGKAGGGLNGTELSVFLDQVMEAGTSELDARDWQAIQRQITSEAVPAANHREANAQRVRLHRARKRLARIVGWTWRRNK